METIMRGLYHDLFITHVNLWKNFGSSEKARRSVDKVSTLRDNAFHAVLSRYRPRHASH